MIYKAQTSHIGSNFSVIDILTVLYERKSAEDKIILSKGWAAAALYYFLARHGTIPADDLDTYCAEGSPYIGLAEPSVAGVTAAGGAMGHGLPMSVGMAMADHTKRVFCVMSDGEMDCGTTWESALIAAHHKVNNLIVFVDYNKWQAMGRKNDVLNIRPLVDKWVSFGWKVQEVEDGNDPQAIADALDADFNSMYIPGVVPLPEGAVGLEGDVRDEALKYKPMVIICHTIKGKGVSFMEDRLLWHYKNIEKAEYELAKEELA
jgi:transketolase